MWIDIEQKQPKLNERVIILIPFGLRVEDDTWTDDGFLNTEEYVSHWQHINAPGTYSEIMQRPKGKYKPKVKSIKRKNNNFTSALEEHFDMMNSLILTQFKLRLEQYEPDNI